MLADCENATRLGNELTFDQKSSCVNLIADYAIDTFGEGIKQHEIIQLALATVSLIEGLKSKTGEPTVSICQF